MVKQKIDKTENDGTKDVKLKDVNFLLKYQSNVWRTLEMSLINCEMYLFLIRSANCFIMVGAIDDQASTFAITNTKFYVPVVILSIQGNANYYNN